MFSIYEREYPITNTFAQPFDANRVRNILKHEIGEIIANSQSAIKKPGWLAGWLVGSQLTLPVNTNIFGEEILLRHTNTYTLPYGHTHTHTSTSTPPLQHSPCVYLVMSNGKAYVLAPQITVYYQKWVTITAYTFSFYSESAAQLHTLQSWFYFFLLYVQRNSTTAHSSMLRAQLFKRKQSQCTWILLNW